MYGGVATSRYHVPLVNFLQAYLLVSVCSAWMVHISVRLEPPPHVSDIRYSEVLTYLLISLIWSITYLLISLISCVHMLRFPHAWYVLYKFSGCCVMSLIRKVFLCCCACIGFVTLFLSMFSPEMYRALLNKILWMTFMLSLVGAIFKWKHVLLKWLLY